MTLGLRALALTLALPSCLTAVAPASGDAGVDAGIVVCPYGEPPGCFCAEGDCAQGERCDAVTGRCGPDLPAPTDAGVGCTAGAQRCAPAPLAAAVQECRAGAWVDLQACLPGRACAEFPSGFGCKVCTAGSGRCVDAHTQERCSEREDAWIASPCDLDWLGQPGRCVDGACQSCTPGQQRCQGLDTLETCAADGLGWDLTFCVITRKCETGATGDRCVPPVCNPREAACIDGVHLGTCRDDGLGLTERDCRALDAFSTPAATCQVDRCVDPCGEAARSTSYLGCEHWAALTSNVGLDESFKAGAVQGSQPDAPSEFGVLVSNANPVPVEVKALRMKAGVEEVCPTLPAAGAQGTLTVAANSVQAIRLPWQGVAQTGQARFGFRLVSTLPVAVHQFNPLVAFTGAQRLLDGEGRCTNCSESGDASLLLPRHALRPHYVVLGSEHLTVKSAAGVVEDAPAFFSIVAVEDATLVWVGFSAPTRASQNGVAIAAQARDSTASYVLNRYDVLQFWTAVDGSAPECFSHPPTPGAPAEVCRHDSDPTGTVIAATAVDDPTVGRPLAVFSGADGAFNPFDRLGRDHLEEAVLPIATWGAHYFGLKSAPYRTSGGDAVETPAPDRWRIVASCSSATCPNGTHVTVSPPPDRYTPTPYCTGDTCILPPRASGRSPAAWVEFEHSGDFRVIASDLVMLGQYLTGQQASPGAAEGDPSLLLAPAEEHWGLEYVVPTMPTMERGYLALVVRQHLPAVSLVIDGKALSAASFPGLLTHSRLGYDIHLVPVPGGLHHVKSSADLGLTVYGYDRATSYGYLGGQDLSDTKVFCCIE